MATESIAYEDVLEQDINESVQHLYSLSEPEEPELLPLVPRLPPSTQFPVDALPVRLLQFATAVYELTYSPLELCIVTLIGFINIIVQGLCDIEFMGSKIPISLYFFIIAASGERKTSVYRLLNKPIQQFENQRRNSVNTDNPDEKNSQKFKDSAVTDLIVSDVTTAALYGVLNRCSGRLGLSSSEAGGFIGGFSMKPENQLAAIAQLSNLFNNESVKIFRKADGDIYIENKRLSILFMGQWMVINKLLSNPLSLEQGFLSRFLITYPNSLIGKRKLSIDTYEAKEVLKQYNEWITSLLNIQLPIKESTRNELDPPALNITTDAWHVYETYYDRVETIMGNLPPDDNRINLINKSPEMALRLAATLQIAEHPQIHELQEDYMSRGCKLAEYFMQEAIRLSSPPPKVEHFEAANTLLTFLQVHNRSEFDLAWLSKAGPCSLRTKQTYTPVLQVLLENGWLMKVEAPNKSNVPKVKVRYRLTRSAKIHLGFQES